MQSVIVYYVLSDPIILSTLYEELVAAIPDSSEIPGCSKLERLPYLISIWLFSGLFSHQGDRLMTNTVLWFPKVSVWGMAFANVFNVFRLTTPSFLGQFLRNMIM